VSSDAVGHSCIKMLVVSEKSTLKLKFRMPL